jgi:hypothetical protein
MSEPSLEAIRRLEASSQKLPGRRRVRRDVGRQH